MNSKFVMEPESVFFVSGRVKTKNDSKGIMTNIIVCSADDMGVRALLSNNRPDFEIVSITAMQSYMNVLKLIKSNLNGDSHEVDVYVDPRLHEAAQIA